MRERERERERERGGGVAFTLVRFTAGVFNNDQRASMRREAAMTCT